MARRTPADRFPIDRQTRRRFGAHPATAQLYPATSTETADCRRADRLLRVSPNPGRHEIEQKRSSRKLPG
jgi:hypothetical protein